jgi:hypothetical protein
MTSWNGRRGLTCRHLVSVALFSPKPDRQSPRPHDSDHAQPQRDSCAIDHDFSLKKETEEVGQRDHGEE